MPFTISHAVLAPSLNKIFKNKLPMAGLAVGCMSPDLVRLFTESGQQSHQWSGLIFPDLFVGLLFSFLWYLIWRPIFYDYLKIRDPLHIHSIEAYSDFFLKLCFTIILGAITHIFWDGFSHDDTKNIAFKGFLAEPIIILNINTRVAILMQMLFSLVPLPIIFYMLYYYCLDHKYIDKKQLINPIWIIICIISAIFFGGILFGKLMIYHMNETKIFSYSILSESIFSFFRGFLSFLVLTLGIIRLFYIKKLSKD